MPTLVHNLDFDWVNARLDAIAGTLGADPDLSAASLPVVTPSPWEKTFEFYYPTEPRRTRAQDTLNRVREALGRVVSAHVHTDQLDLLLQFEWLAHVRLDERVSGKLHRDHILHPAAVCAIGWWLLHDGGPVHLRLDGLAHALQSRCATLAPAIDAAGWRDVAQRAWVLAALIHDLRYPVETLCALEGLCDRASPGLWKHGIDVPVVERAYASTTSVLQSHVTPDDFAAFVRGPKKNHGPLAALMLLEAANSETGLTPRRRLIYELAAVAVLFHHSERQDEIGLVGNPLGYLLALADECHEFGREYMVWQADGTALRVEYVVPVEKVAIKATGDDYSAEFRLATDPAIQAMLKNGGFDAHKYRGGKPKGFDRLNPIGAAGKPVLPFSFCGLVV